MRGWNGANGVSFFYRRDGVVPDSGSVVLNGYAVIQIIRTVIVNTYAIIVNTYTVILNTYTVILNLFQDPFKGASTRYRS